MEDQVLKTYNDYVKHYLYTEFDARIPQVVDKLGLKNYVREKGYKCPATLSVGEDLQTVCSGMFCVPKKFMVKANNDSGGTVLFESNGANYKVNKNPKRLFKYQYEPYGIQKGEWFYGPIIWTLFAEEFLEDNITDFKFHCHNGKVMFCQVIFDRSTGNTKEFLALPDGTKLDYRLDENFAFDTDFDLPENWEDLVEAARVLSEDWKYVRVDLFNHKDTVYCGELTFAPRAGNYTGVGQEKLGQYF